MDIMYFLAGQLSTVAIAWFFYFLGRNTKYQDQNIQPPPAAVQVPKINIPLAKDAPIIKRDPRIIGELDEIDLALMGRGGMEAVED